MEADGKQVSGVQEDTLAAVTDEWQSSKQIHERVSAWARTSVYHQLIVLMREGKIEGKIEPHPGLPDQYRRLFRKLPAQSAAA